MVTLPLTCYYIAFLCFTANQGPEIDVTHIC